MARPRKTEGISTREKIQIAAKTVFAEKGFQRASLDEIAAAVGIAVPSLLYYFPNKDALYWDTIEAVYRDLDNRFQEVLAGPPTTPIQKFVELYVALQEFARSREDLMAVVIAEYASKGSVGQERITQLASPILDRIEHYMKHEAINPLAPDAPLREVMLIVMLNYGVRALLTRDALRVWGEGKHHLELSAMLFRWLLEWPGGNPPAAPGEAVTTVTAGKKPGKGKARTTRPLG